MIHKLCEVNNDEHLESIVKGIEHLLRNKRRTILIMRGNYEEVNKEIEKAIVKFTTSTPSQEQGATTTTTTLMIESTPQVTIGIDTMKVDNTIINLDKTKDPFRIMVQMLTIWSTT